ncbi:MAG: hypothetical protein QOG88_1269 [Actinomycetota bacterium]|nr:hypothetical protein [Actinomycetota bacterium]
MRTTDRVPQQHDRAIDVALWGLTAACVLVTLWFSFVEAPPGGSSFDGADKVGHALAYFATSLSFLFAAVWRPRRGDGRYVRRAMWVPVGAVAFGALIEVLQGLTPTRSPEIGDILAEAAGAGLALAVHGLVRRRTSPESGRGGIRTHG